MSRAIHAGPGWRPFQGGALILSHSCLLRSGPSRFRTEENPIDTDNLQPTKKA